MGVLTANRRNLKCREYCKIKLGLEQVQPVIVEVLVVDRWFHLLQGIDAIKKLGGMHLTVLGEVHFRNLNRCATISIDKPSFSIMFDRSTKALTASWKWASGHSLTEMANREWENTVPDHVRDTYKEEHSL